MLGRYASLCLWLVTSPLCAQGLFEVVDVPVVEVDVVVTDRRNRGVTDLSLDDFRLQVDGETQQIAFFEPPANRASERLGDPLAPVDLVLLFDNNGVAAGARNAIIEDLRTWVGAGLVPELRVTVATIGLTGLEMEQAPTSDQTAIDRALTEVAETVTRDRHVDEYELLLRDIQRVAGVRDPTLRQLRSRAMTLVGRIQAFSDQAGQEVESTVALLGQLVDVLAGLPGRKAILFVGGAMSINPGEALLAALREVLSRADDVGAQRAAADLPASISSSGVDRVASIARSASVHRVAFYSVVVGGAAGTALTGGSAASSGTGDSSQTDSSTTWSPAVDFRQRMETAAAHSALAASTGGFIHTGDRGLPAALDRLQAEIAGSYTLGFHPAGGADGRVHALAVEVEGRRLVVRHRQTFEVWGWDQQAAARVRAGLIFGVTENPVGATLDVRRPQSVSEGAWRIPLTVGLPLDQITVEPVAGDHRGQVSVFVTSAQESLRAEPVRKSVLPIVIPNREIQGRMGQKVEFHLDLEVPTGARRLAIGIRDDLRPQLSVLGVDLSRDPPVTIDRQSSSSSVGRETDESLPALQLPTVALVLSGQNGGPIAVSATATVETLEEGRWRVPVEIEIGSEDGLDAVHDLFLYALTPTGSTVAKISQAVRDRRASLSLELPRGRYVLRLAVRDRADQSFGVTGMEVDIPVAEDGVDAWSTPPFDRPAEMLPRIAPSIEISQGELELGRSVIESRYRRVLGSLAAGDEPSARAVLRAFETEAIRDRPPQAAIDLVQLEARVLIDLADGDWSRLLPFAVLYGDMIEDYRRHRQPLLSENAIRICSELARRMARTARDPAASSESAELLTSLAGHLLYSQRLGRTQELLDLALRKDGSQAVASLALAAVHEQQGEYRSAIETLAALLELEPDRAEGRLRMGINRARLGQNRAALADLDRVAELDAPTWVQQVAVQESVRIRVAQGDIDRARHDLEAAASRWPDQPALRAQLGWLLDTAGETQAAARWVESLVGAVEPVAGSARYRYLDWYTSGLDELRSDLTRRSSDRARQLSRELDTEADGEPSSR